MALTIQQIQDLINKQSLDARQLLNLIADYLQANSGGGGGGGASYLIYTALLSQTGTAAPVATVLENTLDQSVTWTRNSLGNYFGVLDTPIPLNKLFMVNGTDFAGDNTYMIPVGDFSAINGYVAISGVIIGSNIISIGVSTLNAALVPTEWSALLTLTKLPFEFRVYP